MDVKDVEWRTEPVRAQTGAKASCSERAWVAAVVENRFSEWMKLTLQVRRDTRAFRKLPGSSNVMQE